MAVKTYRPTRFVPTASRSGDNYPTILRGQNLFIRGKGDNVYLECYGGSLDLNEPLPAEAITGVISFSSSSNSISGVGTLFKAELGIGQKIQTLAGEWLVVKEVVDDEEFLAYEVPLTTQSGVAAYRLRNLFELGIKRGSLLTGNVLNTDRGTYIGVGTGELMVDGQAISDTLIATKRTQIAIYQPTTNDYLIQTLGFETVPVGIVLSASAAPLSKTFANTDVNIATDSITITAHGYQTGQGITVANPGTLPSPLIPNVVYYVIRIDANTIKLATTLANAVGNSVIDLTAAGSGTTTVTPQSKKMPQGVRSLRIAKASTKLGIPSYGNAGEKIEVTLTTPNERIKIDFPAMDSNADPNDPHDAWRIYGTLFESSTQDDLNAQNGPWYYIRTVTAAELGGTGAGTYYLEYLDAEATALAQLLTFDNDAPPEAEFIGAVGEVLILVSCSGKDGDSPGIAIVSFKTGNLAAAPLVRDDGRRGEVPTSPPEIIIGMYMATGRLYLMTTNTLQIAVFTADVSFPMATRPFWKSGFSNPYALCFANYQLFGFTNAPIRSPEEGTATDGDKEFAADVKELTYGWHPSRVHVIHDPLNECICYVYSAAYKNDAGWWVSVILPLPFDGEGWSMPIIIESQTRDMIISGVATVNGHFEFVAGGRDGVGGMGSRTYRFDGGLNPGETVKWYYAPQYSDDGEESRPKVVKYARIRGKLTLADFGLHGTKVGQAVNVTALEAGNAGSLTGAIPVSDSLEVTVYPKLVFSVNDVMQYTPELRGEWDGSGTKSDGTPYKDRIDELSLEVIVQGSRR